MIFSRLDQFLRNLKESRPTLIKRLTKPMLGFKSFRAAANVLAGVELMHMIRKGQFVIDGTASMSFADQFYALAGQVRPA